MPGAANNYTDAFSTVDIDELRNKKFIIEIGSAPREHEADERVAPSIYAARCAATRLAQQGIVTLFVDVWHHISFEMLTHSDIVANRRTAIDNDAQLLASLIADATRVVDADRRSRKLKRKSIN